MAKKPETKFKEKVLRELRRIPGSWWSKIAQASIRGTPDILGCVVGRFVAVELKTDEGELDELQRYHLSAISSSRGVAFVATPSEWDEQVKEIWRLIEEPMETDNGRQTESDDG